MHQLTEENLGKFEQRMRAVDQTLDAKLTQNETRVERLRETVEQSLQTLRTENAQKLDRCGTPWMKSCRTRWIGGWRRALPR